MARKRTWNYKSRDFSRFHAKLRLKMARKAAWEERVNNSPYLLSKFGHQGWTGTNWLYRHLHRRK